MRLKVWVKPRSGKSELSELPDGSWVAWLRSPPVDGAANAELVALLAERFGCRRQAVTIRAGAGTRAKWVEITR